tara:strand:- start:847 stop:1308 length:462 start_codon:yes stop_codon:yes gene_type:complete
MGSYSTIQIINKDKKVMLMKEKLEMLPCPKCGDDFPKLRKELYNYHTCVNCSTTEPVVGITTVEGTGDHTYNDLIIMDQSRARAIAVKAGLVAGKKVNLELLDLDADEEESVQSMKERINRISDKNTPDEDDHEDDDEDEQEDEDQGVEGIDY